MRNFGFLVFVFLTFCCWGVYGPVLHIGQEAMGEGPKKLSSLRPFICVGVAYFLIAVVYPLIVLYTKGEKGNWSPSGFVWSFVAGAVGAIGALGIILAFKFGGKPVFVMPLVFGLAPIVNTFVTMFSAGTFKQATMRFFLGIIIVAVGAAGVLTYKPAKPKSVETKTAMQTPMESSLTNVVFRPTQESGTDEASTETSDDPKVGKTTEESAADDKATEDTASSSVKTDVKTDEPAKTTNWPLVGLCIAITALCWGSYGTVLHKGQAKMGGSRLRPFLCVGLAYFAIAVIVPFFLLGTFQEPGGWNVTGSMWSLLAGAAGAIGALGIIYAFNFGGKPIFIMPLVFGLAPVVNTMIETFSKNLWDQVTMPFMISLLMVICGAVMVLVFAPRGPKPKPAN
ncbi:MAG: hypothetical protein AB8B55_18000 [Mariniblastus sp.]